MKKATGDVEFKLKFDNTDLNMSKDDILKAKKNKVLKINDGGKSSIGNITPVDINFITDLNF